MGAYSATPLDADGAGSVTAAPAEPENPETAVTAAEIDDTTGTGDPVSPAPAPVSGERTMKTTLSRAFGWVFFVGGLVGAVLGIAGLHVEITVAGLILACTAGLVLLKLRSDNAVPGEGQVAEA